MVNRYGVIDLGSNTFHLLIVERNENGIFSHILKERAFVGLAENGIEQLSPSAMNKGLAALRNFKDILKRENVTQFSVIGTSALRSAKNSLDFLDAVKNELGIEIEVIDGTREAELIYKGVRQLLPSNDQCQIIIDVGGGSVEFILIDSGQMIWAQSYDLGVGVLYNYISMEDPCNVEEVKILTQYINQKLASLKKVVSKRDVDILIGASGSFEVIQKMNGDGISSDSLTEIAIQDYQRIAESIISSTLKERLAMDGLPESRVKLIVVAMILIDTALDIIKPQKLMVSPYALKEGVLSELTEV